MAEYKVWRTNEKVEIVDAKNFQFPSSGAKILLKERPPIAKTIDTD